MSFIVSGLPVEPFQPLFGLSDEALAERNIVRRTVEAGDRLPCRITLDDASPGDTLLLLNYEHQEAATPYRSTHAIFVNERADAAATYVDTLPPVFPGRTLALRAFDADGMMTWAEITPGEDAAAAIARGFADPAVAYIHAHNAARGCFAARIDRG
jgi:hypothetical protein